MSVDPSRYFAMARAAYARLVDRSDCQDESFTSAGRVEFVVGSYV